MTTQFQKGDMVASKSGKEYLVTDVYDVGPKGQRYGIQRMRDGSAFGPYRNFYDDSGFRLVSRKDGAA